MSLNNTINDAFDAPLFDKEKTSELRKVAHLLTKIAAPAMEKYSETKKYFDVFTDLDAVLSKATTGYKPLDGIKEDVKKQLGKLSDVLAKHREALQNAKHDPDFKEKVNELVKLIKSHIRGSGADVSVTFDRKIDEDKDRLTNAAVVSVKAEDKSGFSYQLFHRVATLEDLGASYAIVFSEQEDPTVKWDAQYNNRLDKLEFGPEFEKRLVDRLMLMEYKKPKTKGDQLKVDLMSVFGKVSEKENDYVVSMSFDKELDDYFHKTELHLDKSRISSVTSSLKYLCKNADDAGGTVSGRVSFGEIDYYSGGSFEVPSWRIEAGKVSESSSHRTEIPKDWTVELYLTFSIPKSKRNWDKKAMESLYAQSKSFVDGFRIR